MPSKAQATPSDACEYAASKQPATRAALNALGYTGPYTLFSAFNTTLLTHHSILLQEIHIEIDLRRPSAALLTAIARVLFPFPVVVHARDGREYALPIIPPPESGAMSEKQYWELARKENVCTGTTTEGWEHAPRFQRGPIEEDLKRPSFCGRLFCA
ncbi:hypothetical protein DXG03_002549 [Asterophora parasitica]|uniref:Uncharacterized protein n=1 Tax=Asterophora parasitica TaxID=117018 RepID=A0A9P7G8D0_9AGAR|nr:hypothetical protein DXG03_002549 [Asterophora parasitica]